MARRIGTNKSDRLEGTNKDDVLLGDNYETIDLYIGFSPFEPNDDGHGRQVFFGDGKALETKAAGDTILGRGRRSTGQRPVRQAWQSSPGSSPFTMGGRSRLASMSGFGDRALDAADSTTFLAVVASRPRGARTNSAPPEAARPRSSRRRRSGAAEPRSGSADSCPLRSASTPFPLRSRRESNRYRPRRVTSTPKWSVAASSTLWASSRTRCR